MGFNLEFKWLIKYHVCKFNRFEVRNNINLKKML